MDFNTDISVAIMITQKNIFDTGSKAQDTVVAGVKPA